MKRHIVGRYGAGPYVITSEVIGGRKAWRVCKPTTAGALRVEWPVPFRSLPEAYRAVECYLGHVLTWKLDCPPPSAAQGSTKRRS